MEHSKWSNSVPCQWIEDDASVQLPPVWGVTGAWTSSWVTLTLVLDWMEPAPQDSPPVRFPTNP